MLMLVMSLFLTNCANIERKSDVEVIVPKKLSQFPEPLESSSTDRSECDALLTECAIVVEKQKAAIDSQQLTIKAQSEAIVAQQEATQSYKESSSRATWIALTEGVVIFLLLLLK